MGTDQTRADSKDLPADPADLLPDDSILSLDEYLDMHAAVGHRPRYEILYRLVYNGEMSPTELKEEMDIDDRTLDQSLNRLIDAGLIEKRCCTDCERDELYVYYRATVFGEVTLTEGINELIKGEQGFGVMYDSSAT